CRADNSIMVGGWFTSFNSGAAPYLILLNSDGTRNTGFNQSGTGFNGIIYGIAETAGGKFLITGNQGTYNSLASVSATLLNADGSLDNSFAATAAGFNERGRSGLIAGTKLLVSGFFSSYDGAPASRVARLNLNGTLDTTFAPVGAGLDGIGTGLALDSAGRILTWGTYTTYGTTALKGIARLNSDGNLDSTFLAGSGNLFDQNPTSGLIDSDSQKIYVTGPFTTLGSTSAPYLVRLNSDGTLDTQFQVEGSGFNGALSLILQFPD
ncbi:MAG: delta-60 repeat domain-containing protein, partial [Bdellovibrionales bacterium]|nr:delta-60 repeat domain-containing protein [Bdellovibrionales bacterium]